MATSVATLGMPHESLVKCQEPTRTEVGLQKSTTELTRASQIQSTTRTKRILASFFHQTVLTVVLFSPHPPRKRLTLTHFRAHKQRTAAILHFIACFVALHK